MLNMLCQNMRKAEDLDESFDRINEDIKGHLNGEKGVLRLGEFCA
jgi:hypothetical protein